MVRALALLFVLLPGLVMAADAPSDTLATSRGPLVIHPVAHASFVMQWNGVVIAVDPVGELGPFMAHGRPALVLVTHKHGDHFNADILRELAGDETLVITSQQVAGSVPALDPVALANGESRERGQITITAVPAYNHTAERGQFHPQGQDNGYLVDLDGFRVYISGDTEDVPEMAASAPVDAAFLCMNLPWTMSVDQAAKAVALLQPGVLYPYHYRNRDGSHADLERLDRLVDPTVEIRRLSWY